MYTTAGKTIAASGAKLSGDRVTATFRSIDSEALADSLSGVTVSTGAVTDSGGSSNVVGSIPIEGWFTYTSRGDSACASLTRVGELRVVGHTTRLNYVFRCFDGSEGTPTIRANGKRFRLQLVNGAVRSGLRRRIHPNGVITVVFPGRLRNRQVARTTVPAGAVRVSTWDALSGLGDSEVNEPEAAPISHRGNTVRPDLVRVKLRPKAVPARAVFVFDQRVSRPNARRFRLFPHAPVKGRRAVVRKAHPRQVRVVFGHVTVRRAENAAVARGAVRSGRSDEFGITRTATWYRNMDGYIDGPDFDGASLKSKAGSLTVSFVFGKTFSGAPDTSAFHLYTDDGKHRLDASSCTVAPAQGQYIHPVDCTFDPASAGPGLSWTVGAADTGAVSDAKGNVNMGGANVLSTPNG